MQQKCSLPSLKPMLTNNNKISPEYFLRKVKEIKGIPTITGKLLMLLTQNNVSIKDIEQVLSKDPTLLTRILIIANSPVYRRGQEICTAKDAIMILGTKAIIYYSMFMAVKGMSQQSSNVALKLWEHSLAVSTMSKLLAKEVGISPDIATSAGLLHDIGNIIIDNIAPKSFAHVLDIQKKYNYDETRIIELERETIGIDHCEIGSYLAKTWNFPSLFTNIIEKHHNCSPDNTKVSEIENDSLLSTIRVADCESMTETYKENKCHYKDKCVILSKYKKHIEKIYEKFLLSYKQDKQLLFA